MGDGHGATSFRSGMLLVGAWLAGGLVFVLAVAAAGLLARPHADIGHDSPLGITAFGTLFLSDPEADYDPVSGSPGRACVGQGSFADLKPGAPVAIRAGGRVVATGSLNGGIAYDGICHFSWAATGVPTGLVSYQVVMDGRGSVDVDEEALAVEVPLQVEAPLGQLTLRSVDAGLPFPFPAGSGLPSFVAGALILPFPDGQVSTFAACTGTGVNADVVPGAELVLRRDGTPIGSVKLGPGVALRPTLCVFNWIMMLSGPPAPGEFTVGLAGHGAVPVELGSAGGLPVAVQLVLDGSGQLRRCEQRDFTRC